MSTSTTAAAEKAEMFETLSVISARLIVLAVKGIDRHWMPYRNRAEIADLVTQAESLLATLQEMDR